MTIVYKCYRTRLPTRLGAGKLAGAGKAGLADFKHSTEGQMVRRVPLTGQPALPYVCFTWHAPPPQQPKSGIPRIPASALPQSCNVSG